MIRTVLIGLALSFAVATGPAAPPAAAQEDAVQRELAGIRKSLEDIVRLLRQSRVDDERSLLLRRIEIKSQRITPLDSAIRDAIASGRDLESEEAHLRDYLNELDRQLAEADPGPQAANDRQERQQVEAHIEQMRGVQWNNQQRILDLEVERTTLNEEIQALEAQLDRLTPKDP